MSTATTPETTTTARASAPRRRRRYPIKVWAALVVLALFALVALFGPMLWPYDANATDLGNRLAAPGTRLDSGSIAWLGTDQLGRDLLANIAAGSRVSLVVALATVAIGGAVGMLIGVVSGYFRGWTDTILSRIGDIQLAFPSILLAILIAGVLGPSVTNIVITLAVTRWVIFARVVRGSGP